MEETLCPSHICELRPRRDVGTNRYSYGNAVDEFALTSHSGSRRLLAVAETLGPYNHASCTWKERYVEGRPAGQVFPTDANSPLIYQKWMKEPRKSASRVLRCIQKLMQA